MTWRSSLARNGSFRPVFSAPSSRSLWQSRVLEVTPPLRIGILGAARIVPNAIVKPTAKQPHLATAAAIAARDSARARLFAEKQGIAKVHASYEDLIADPEIDAVYNPLPNNLHCSWTIRALRSGKHVLCEKPFAANAAQAEEMLRAADETGMVLMEAFHYRYHPFALRVKRIVDEGTLGDIHRIESFFCVPMRRRNDIRMRFDLAGGTLMDLGCYCVNLVRYLAGGEPEILSATAGRVSDAVDREMDVEMGFGKRLTARVVCAFNSWRNPLKIVTSVYGSQGEMHAVNPFVPMLFNWITIKTASGTRRQHVRGAATYDYQLDAFVRAVSSGEEFPTSAMDAIANMRVLDAAYRKAGLPLRGT
jgi:predicted dehydrogenase